MNKIKNFINGELAAPVSGNYLDNYDPAIGDVYSQVPDSDEQDIDLAVQAAERAFPSWSVTPAQERSNIMMRIADLIDQNLDRLAQAESVDNGKPLRLAKTVDIPRASSNFRFFATAILHFASESHIMEDSAINYTLRKSIGVAGCISPWNLPLYLFTWKIAPAFAAGNCVVGKPSEITPMTAYLLSELCVEAGLPAGVLNIVHGYGPKVGAAMSAHPGIPVMSFTGGTKTGTEISKTASPLFKKLSLEMGGKNPNIIFADCKYEEMMQATLKSSFSNQGQICLCGSRVFIERSLYERFRDDFVERTKTLNVGDPMSEDSDLGAVVSGAHMEKILSYIELAKQEGGTLLCGGNQVKLSGRCKHGWFVEPTVIEGLPHDCRTNQEEIFGPVVTLMPFDTEDEVVKYANSTQYGLSATIWTEDLTRAHRLANQVQSGIIWINCWMLRDLRTPFGGMKNSGLGREGGFEALRFFTEPKNVCVKL
ncbi:aldehyde dehydrogenase [candidate division KSB1 bacterium]|nr:aldehyde dehydrogenase [candidate division KSB1 bacterium]NIR70204.1 aldehyde dehydrogenase [candidate division KSB1 bacterium]NIS27591.1 aldehyde dehydrogenase [candidate division KSB1 bacterium]NIT74443.1 aldehyde dehydrogenase [candidate division KSB1 bacterium]NIU28308.1 aldehyde dehydrogenase [candidate division KSB1 bacterium]